MTMVHLDKSSSEEFLEAYKGVLPEYHDMTVHMASGACVAMEVRQVGNNKFLRSNFF
jgi:nucleoside-diphosphate kinase